MSEKMVPIIVLKNNLKNNRYLPSSMDLGEFEDADLDITIEEIQCAFMIYRKDLLMPDESDIENVRKESEAHKKFMIEKFGKDAIVSFDFEEILKVYEPVNIEISLEKFEASKEMNE
ncbi:hypothetical protein ACM26V_00305 [Salipaludibacillus sp. HK11]|uniref:hypothetical protein n=1 Tax=Salipaludibacillus sp. HK11 TaxID=3394320 RepID=UPI0039FCD08A